MKPISSKAEYIIQNGKPKAVILPLAEYEALLEDLHDLSLIARRRDEPLRSSAEVKQRLKNAAVRG